MRRPLPPVEAWLVRRLVPPSLRPALLADLEEEFALIEARDGRRAARRWLRRQLLSADWLRLHSLPAPSVSPAGQAARLFVAAPPKARSVMSRLVSDFRSALRTLRRQPRFAFSVVSTVAVGIVGATTMLAATDAVLFKALPYDGFDRLVALRASSLDGELNGGPVSWVNLNEWAALDVFESVFAIQGDSMTLRGRGNPEAQSVARVSPQTLAALGAVPYLGRAFQPSDGIPGNDHVVLLSHARWRALFDSDPAALGQTLMLDDEPYQVVGVLPDGMRLPVDLEFNHERDLWVPLAPRSDDMPRTRRAVQGYARLRPGVSVGEARAALDAAFAEQQRRDPEANSGWRVGLLTVVETIVGPFRAVLLVMLGASLLLLALACANLTNLMLAHWASHRRELAIRAALGAGRTQLVRQLLTQGLVLGLIGGLTGVVGSYWLVMAFTRLTPGDVPRLEEAVLTLPVAAVALGAAGVLGLLFATGPALLCTGGALVGQARSSSRTSTPGRWEQQALGLMVTAQISIAVMLLTGAGLLGRSFTRLVGVDPGFNVDRVATVLIMLNPPDYPDLAARTRFTEQAIEELGAIPGVTRVGVTNFLPFSGTNTVDGFSVNNWDPIRQSVAGYRAADDGYFDVLRIPVLRGRGITADDIASNAPVALVSDTMARQHFGDEDPIGRLIQRGSPARESRGWLEIVGVVGDVRHDAPDEPVIAEWYAPYTGDPYTLKFFTLRTAVPAEDVVAAARDVLGRLDARMAPLAVQTMSSYFDEHVAGPRFNAATFASFALAAIAIAAVGLFGVVANLVARRVRELGIRMALGASARQVRNAMLARGVRMALPGIALGLGGAMLLSQTLVGLLRGVSPHDPATMAIVAGLALVVTGLACYLPARRAAAVDPVDVLRLE